MGISGSISDDLRKEVLIAEAGHSGRKHLGDGKLSAVAHHLGTDPALFDRPYPVAQPRFERHILSKAAEKRHRGMRMCIHEARNQNVPVPLDQHARLIRTKGLL